MGLFFTWLSLDLTTIFLFTLTSLYVYVARKYKYFQKRGLPYESPVFPCGCLFPAVLLKTSFAEIFSAIYARNKKHKLVGYFTFWKKGVVINDLQLIKNILVKDFDFFQDRGIYHSKEIDPLSAHLFTIDGVEWKALRIKLSPTFTSAKMKSMFNTVVEHGLELTKYIDKLTRNDDVIECKDLFSRYGLAVIASTAFGLETASLSDESSTFLEMAKQVIAPNVKQMVRSGFTFYCADLAKVIKLRVIPRQASNFFRRLVKDTVCYRESSGIKRKDFLQLLIDLKNENREEGQLANLTIDEVAAEAFVFILAGFETSSNTMSFCLYQLALNPDMQRKLHAEIDSVNDLTYETLNSLEYLDMVVNETLRMYPPLAFINRVCTKNYKVPGTDAVIEKGTQVIISNLGLHSDPDLFPDPLRFNPERFSKSSLHEIKPYSYMPFGEGPRFCIGMRFGKMQVKAGLALLLRKFEVHIAESTPIPVVLEPKTILSTPAGGMWLKISQRKM